MKQSDAVKAYVSAVELNKQRLSGSIANKIFKLVNALQPCWDFQIQEEEKIFKEHPFVDPKLGICLAEDASEDERVKASLEMKSVNESLRSLSEIEIEPIEFESFTIDLEQENIKLSGEDIGRLKDFINFV